MRQQENIHLYMQCELLPERMYALSRALQNRMDGLCHYDVSIHLVYEHPLPTTLSFLHMRCVHPPQSQPLRNPTNQWKNETRQPRETAYQPVRGPGKQPVNRLPQKTNCFIPPENGGPLGFKASRYIAPKLKSIGCRHPASSSHQQPESIVTHVEGVWIYCSQIACAFCSCRSQLRCW